jgi:hypothetical protein
LSPRPPDGPSIYLLLVRLLNLLASGPTCRPTSDIGTKGNEPIKLGFVNSSIAGSVGVRQWFIAAALGIQLTVPILALLDGVPSRFGFHMYSGHNGIDVRAEDIRGTDVKVNWGHLVAHRRPELDWTSVLPERICADVPEAARVTVRSGQSTRSLECSR